METVPTVPAKCRCVKLGSTAGCSVSLSRSTRGMPSASMAYSRVIRSRVVCGESGSGRVCTGAEVPMGGVEPPT